MAPVNLAGLYPQVYEHPDDAAALDALKHTAGLDLLVRKISAWGMERFLRIQLTGSYLRVTPDNFPDLWRILITARDRLALPITPGLYIQNQEESNAFTAGAEKPVIVVNSGAIDHLEEDELLFVIAHEIGHIKSGHVLYYQIASYIPMIGSFLGDLTLGLGGVLSTGLQVALLHWQRTSELTADRAGLLGCQDCPTSMPPRPVRKISFNKRGSLKPWTPHSAIKWRKF
jgi:Zn-dependent protease with chaperone function